MATRDEMEAMLARIAVGDAAAFSAFYAATSDKLFGVALNVLRDRAEAEDALQETYVKVWLKADRYRVMGLSPMTWLVAVTRHQAVDLRRRRSGTIERPLTVPLEEASEEAAPQPSPEEDMLASALRSRLTECLAELCPRQADAVCRAYLLGETQSDLAARSGVPLNTFKTRLRRSLLRLRAGLDPAER